MSKKIVILLGLFIFATGLVYSQDDLDEVHLFQNFFRDATITSNPYGEGYFNFSSYEYGSSIALAAQGGYGINPNLEVNAALGFTSFSPENGDGTSGITDLYASGRYLVVEQNELRVAAGGFLTLPIGAEDAGYGNLDFGAFGALRYAIDNGMVITGTLGLDFYETTEYEFETPQIINGQLVGGELKEKTEYKNSLVLAGGVIYPLQPDLALVGELMFKTDVDYGMLSGGADYILQNNGRVRGMLGIGIDDGAPDIMLQVSYLMGF